jgi:hypothetical protein
MGIETTPPSESVPEPDALPATTDDHVALTGNLSIRSMAAGGLTLRSDTPLPLRMVDPAILSNWDQPQPQLPQRPPPFVPEGPAEPPFPPPSQTVGPAMGGFQPGAFQSDAFQGAGAIQVDPTRSGGTAPQVIGTQGNSEAEEIPPVIADGRLETLEARVAVLEAALAARPSNVALASRPPGIGHNHGPYLDENLNVDEASIQSLVDLLKVQRATAPVDLAKLVEAAKVADPTINKWQERVDIFVKGILFGAGKVAGDEITKQLAHAAWVQSVFSALQAVYEAIRGLFF